MKRLFAIAVAALAFSSVATAEVSPERGAYDARVRVVDYNPYNVIRLTTFYGVSTHIQFGDGEKIQDIATGDDQAWALIPRSGNHLFIKPKAEKADTNLTVVTNKRTYQFVIMVRPNERTNETAWRDPNLIYSLSFRYPDEELARLQADAEAERKKSAKVDIQDRLASAKVVDTNYDYWIAGALEASPTAASDNGEFTRLTFGNRRAIPEVFAVDANGVETLLPKNTEGNQIILHRVYRKVILRKGTFVACIVNKSFNFDGGKTNNTGTIAPDVKRVIKGVSN